MAKFVQIIEFQTTKFDEMMKVIDEYRGKTEGKRTVRHVLNGKVRDRDNTYMTIVEFDSYEDARKNNDLPETAEMAQKMQALGDGPPTFYDIDVSLEQND